MQLLAYTRHDSVALRQRPSLTVKSHAVAQVECVAFAHLHPLLPWPPAGARLCASSSPPTPLTASPCKATTMILRQQSQPVFKLAMQTCCRSCWSGRRTSLRCGTGPTSGCSHAWVRVAGVQACSVVVSWFFRMYQACFQHACMGGTCAYAHAL
jgi:hypothetical protein